MGHEGEGGGGGGSNVTNPYSVMNTTKCNKRISNYFGFS